MVNDRINDAIIEEAPFPHIVIDNFLSVDELEMFYSQLPQDSQFDWNKVGLGYFGFWPGSASVKMLNQEQQQYFLEFQNRYFSNEAAGCILNKFKPYLNNLHRKLFGSEQLIKLQDWNESGGIDIRIPGNKLPIHLDWPNRLFSVILYLDPGNNCKPGWGTRLYEVDQNSITDPLEVFSQRRKLSHDEMINWQYRTIDFVPNRLVVFMNTPWSFHGAIVPSVPGSGSRYCFLKGLNITKEQTEKLFGLPPELRD